MIQPHFFNSSSETLVNRIIDIYSSSTPFFDIISLQTCTHKHPDVKSKAEHPFQTFPIVPNDTDSNFNISYMLRLPQTWIFFLYLQVSAN